MKQNYSNPFNPGTTILYQLPERSAVQLTIVNILGEVVANLVDGEQSAGQHTVEWQGRTDGGEQAARGVYFYRIQARSLLDSEVFMQTKKLLLLK